MNISNKELIKIAEENKQSMKELLASAGYDAEYLLEWGIPDFWDEKYWIYPHYIIRLFAFLVKKFSLSISMENFDLVFDT
jgi:hypothetical protein